MTTPLPEPSHSGPDGTGTYFDSYTAADLRDYGAKCEKTLTAALQAMTAERDDALYAGRLLVQRCDRLVTERDALKADAERLDALGTLLNCTHSGDGGYFLELKFSYFASLHRLTLRQAIDAAMKGKS